MIERLEEIRTRAIAIGVSSNHDIVILAGLIADLTEILLEQKLYGTPIPTSYNPLEAAGTKARDISSPDPDSRPERPAPRPTGERENS